MLPVYASEFRQRIVGSRVEILDRAAHLPHLEQFGVAGPMVQAFLRE